MYSTVYAVPANFAVQFLPQVFPLSREDVCFPTPVFQYHFYDKRCELNFIPTSEMQVRKSLVLNIVGKLGLPNTVAYIFEILKIASVSLILRHKSLL